MLHITCDYCHREITPGAQDRYVVKIEVYPAQDPTELTEADLDEDHLEAVSQLLCDSEDNPEDLDLVTTAYKNMRYDLCPACHKKFLNDPLGRDATQKYDFSEN